MTSIISQSESVQKITDEMRTPDLDALCNLRARGAHFVLCVPNKQPLVPGWQRSETAPDDDAIRRHLNSPPAAPDQRPLLGVIPRSIDCLVIDVDEGG
ncbi:bifunctional DNA primase/polymerase [Chloroflexi bacterium TSY]|nr:bifunctional DNA primase/polymerase [Chloroflexi bacterium TSY]